MSASFSSKAGAGREEKLSALAAAFLRLPERQRRRCSHTVTGNGQADTFVFAETRDGSCWYEGVIVAGERDEARSWMLDAVFTMFTTDVVPEGELITVHGYNCHVERL